MTTQTWIAGTTGLWTTDTDWSPGPAPGEGDTALVTLPGNDLIEIPGDVFVESVVLDDVGATFAISGTLIVDKTLAIAAGEVDVAGSLSAGDLSNAGTIRNSGFVTVGTIDTASLERITGGEVDIDGTLENSGSTLDVSDLSSSPLILNWGLIEGGVVVDLLVDVSATLDAVTLEGTLTNRGYVGIENGLSVIGSGGIFADGGTFAFAGTADLDVNLSGSGTIIAVDALTIAAAVSVTEAPGGFTNGISGLVFNGGTIVNNGTILGTSTSGDGTDEIHDGLIAVGNGDFENFGVVDVADASPEVSQVGNPAAREGFARTSITAGMFDNEVGAVIETGEAFGTGSITIEAATAFTNDGLLSTWDQVASRGGTIDVAAPVGGTGLIEVTERGYVTLESAVDNTQTIAFSGAGYLTLDQPRFVRSVIDGFNAADTILLNGISTTAISYSDGDLKLAFGAGSTFDLGITGTFTLSDLAINASASQTEIQFAPDAVPCFAAGGRIEMGDGAITEVENLRVGDVVTTAAGESQPIQWIGHRRIDCRRHPDPRSVWPVRIHVGAFSDGVPRRDLRLSPDHAIFINDVLIPIKYLLTGNSIEQLPVDEITYYHIELPRHDILLVEGLPAESYLDTGDRGNFDNADRATRLFPEFSRRNNYCLWEAHGCAPLVVTGPALDAARRLLEERARGQGWYEVVLPFQRLY